MCIALIPFARNLFEFTGNKEFENKLTSLLHIKSDTRSITVGDLEIWLVNIFNDLDFKRTDRPSTVLDLIYGTADNLLTINDVSMELEDKIVLSIATRLKCEEFLINKINDQNFLDTIKSNQTYKLICKYKELHQSEYSIIKLLEQMNLMTPENIHLNSFMYEPLLDMSNQHLKTLYEQIKALH